MPVVINDFEITVESPKPEAAQSAVPDDPEDAPQTLRPEDVARIERHYRKRKQRIKAD